MTEIRNICCISYSKLQEKKNSIFLGGILQSGSILISSIFSCDLGSNPSFFKNGGSQRRPINSRCGIRRAPPSLRRPIWRSRDVADCRRSIRCVVGRGRGLREEILSLGIRVSTPALGCELLLFLACSCL